MTSEIDKLQQEVCHEMREIISQMNGQPHVLDREELLIIGPRVMLWLPIDRDGLGLWYVQQVAFDQFQIYQLSAVLAARDSAKIDVEIPQPRTAQVQIKAAARAYALRLKTVGQDILGGNERWMVDYMNSGSKPLPLPKAIAAELSRITRQE